MSQTVQQVLSSRTANLTAGSGTIVVHSGGELEVIVAGVLGGATVTLNARFAGTSTWVPVDGGEWTTPLVKSLRISRPCELTFSLANAGGSTSVNAWM